MSVIFLGITLGDTDIVDIFRLSKRQVSNGPGLVVVEFLNKRARNDIYSVRVQLKNFKETILHIHEDLCPYYANLFYQVRRTCKEKNYFSCWTRNGASFVKLNKDSVPIRINSESEIESKLLNTQEEL